MTEQEMWRSIRESFPGMTQRFEDKLSVGIPDLNWCFQGKEIWIENKFQQEKICLMPGNKKKVHVTIRPAQALWLRKRKKCGGNVFILMKCGKDQWWLFNDHFLDLLNSITPNELHEKCLCMWYGKFDWEIIYNAAK